MFGLTDNDLEIIIKEFRNKRCIELFNKNENEIDSSDKIILDNYIHDYNHPIWKDIIYDWNITMYEVSNIGQIRNKYTKKILKPALNNFGYLKVGISVNRKVHTQKVHRLVAQTFIPNPENKPEVNHISCVKTCNWIGNLEWVTSSENKIHAHIHSLYDNRLVGEEKYNAKHTNEQVHQICKLLEQGKQPKEIANILGISESCPRSIKYYGRWNHIAKQYKIPKVGDIPRYNTNESSSWNKISKDTAIKICELLQQGKTNSEISSLLKVSDTTVMAIRDKKTWKFLSKDLIFPNTRDKFQEITKYKKKISKMILNGENDFGYIIKQCGVSDGRNARRYIASLKHQILKKTSSTTIDQSSL